MQTIDDLAFEVIVHVSIDGGDIDWQAALAQRPHEPLLYEILGPIAHARQHHQQYPLGARLRSWII